VTAAIAGIASFLIVIASQLPSLRVVPAAFYGFAATFAYLSLSPGAFSVEVLTSPSLRNAAFSVPVSLLVGTGLGIVHTWLASALAGHGGSKRISLSNAHISSRGKTCPRP
jgi:hypothetical protein